MNNRSKPKAKKTALAPAKKKTELKAVSTRVSSPVSSPPPPIAIPIEKAVLAPELAAQIQRPIDGHKPLSTEPTPIMTEREKAREARRKQREAEIEALRVKRQKERVTAPVSSIPEIPDSSPKPSNVVPISAAVSSAPASEPPKNGHISVPISEAIKYKLLYCESKYKSVCEPIRQALKAAAERKFLAEKAAAEKKLLEDIDAAVKADAGCVAAFESLQAAANEALESIKDSIPKGHQASYIATEQALVICKPKPETGDDVNKA